MWDVVKKEVDARSILIETFHQKTKKLRQSEPVSTPLAAHHVKNWTSQASQRTAMGTFNGRRDASITIPYVKRRINPPWHIATFETGLAIVPTNLSILWLSYTSCLARRKYHTEWQDATQVKTISHHTMAALGDSNQHTKRYPIDMSPLHIYEKHNYVPRHVKIRP